VYCDTGDSRSRRRIGASGWLPVATRCIGTAP